MADDPEHAPFGPMVQEEVNRLPEKYRSVVVLCYWDGLTQEQAAFQLGCPIGTVRSRVARARDILRKRLVRRGLAPAAGAIATALDPSISWAGVAPAQVPPDLIRSSVDAALRVAAGRATAEVVSAGVTALVQGILWRMTVTKLRLLGVGFMMVGVVTVGLVSAAQKVRQKGRDQPPAADRAPAVRRESDPVAAINSTTRDYVVEPPDLILVEVLEALPGRPISGERLVRPDGKISLGFYGDLYVAGLTIPEIKEKVVLHLKKHLSEETLGLTVQDPETNRITTTNPRDTDRVFVDVAAWNSKFFYVQGEFQFAGTISADRPGDRSGRVEPRRRLDPAGGPRIPVTLTQESRGRSEFQPHDPPGRDHRGR